MLAKRLNQLCLTNGVNMKKILVSAYFLTLSLVLGNSFAYAENTLATPIAIAKILANPQTEYSIIDVRTPKEFFEGHLDGAILIDFIHPQFRNNIDKLEKDKQYILHCRTGVRSAKAMEIMKELGFENVMEMEGGYNEWVRQNLPVIKN